MSFRNPFKKHEKDSPNASRPEDPDAIPSGGQKIDRDKETEKDHTAETGEPKETSKKQQADDYPPVREEAGSEPDAGGDTSRPDDYFPIDDEEDFERDKANAPDTEKQSSGNTEIAMPHPEEARPEPKDEPPRVLLDIRNLNIHTENKYNFGDEEYGKTGILHNINIEVYSNSFVAVVGESGSGKSLLSKALFQLLPENEWQVSGVISYDGIPILNGYEYQPGLRHVLHHNIAGIFQEPTSYFNPSMRVWQQITERNVLHPDLKHDYADLRQKLIQVHIMKSDSDMGMDYLSRYPHQFSQGQQQRLMWTMTLYPFQMLIADEPTASLDTTIQKEIVDLLVKRRRRGEISSMLLFTHDLRLVKALLTEAQDQIYFLGSREKGGYEIKCRHTPQELFHEESGNLSDFVRRKIRISRSLGFEKGSGSPESANDIHMEISNLKQGYKHGLMGKSKTVLHIPDLTIYRGEIVGLVGESGCGKSTFARAVVRLLNHTDPKSEIVYYRKSKKSGQTIGYDLVELQPNADRDKKEMRRLRRRIQIIFQDAATAFNPEMTLRETFDETFRLYPYRKKEEALHHFIKSLRLARSDIEIEKLLASYPSDMSAGQRQRLTLVRALLADPEFLILDEPFTNVDRETTHDMMRLIKKRQQSRDMTCIMISHDLSLVLEVCDRIIVMEAGSDGIGREHQSGPPEELLANPRPYTKKLLQSRLTV